MRPFLKAEWKNLVMANYIVDAEVLKPYIPLHTELDTFNGNIYISLVAFMFAETRIMGFKIPFHVDFEEVNLRFYVRHNHNGDWRRGVVFIKEIVPKYAISFVANNLYREKYCTMKMNHAIHETTDDFTFEYKWRYQNKWNQLKASTSKTALPMLENSEAHFIAEHYWGYSKYDDQTTFEYEVQHVPWNIYPLKEYAIDCNFKGIYGDSFSFLQNRVPESVFVAQGSPIAVLHKRKL